MTDNDLALAQREREEVTVQRGIERYQERTLRKVKREGFDKHEEVQKLIRGAVPIVSAGLRQWIDEASQAKGRKSAALKALAEVDSDNAAAVGITAIFRSLGDGGRVSQITKFIGRWIEAELEGLAIEENDPKTAARFLKLAEGVSSEKVLEERFRALIDEHEAALRWTDQTRVLVGQAVLNVALKELRDLFVLKTVQRQAQTHVVIELTDEAAEALMEMEDAAAAGHLPLRPMVAKPKPWVGMHSGAYYDYRLSRLVPMVRAKSKEQRQLLKEAIAAGEIDEVLEALNAIQDTRWAIDTRVLKWVQWVRKGNLRTGKSFPAPEQPELPPRSEPEAWEAMSQDERTARMRKRRSVKLMRQAIGVDQKTFKEDIAEAEELAGYECFYLPHTLDFRGRTYAVPYFNHQRSDHMKALFRFADGLPLGDEGGFWLKVHLANCGDFGKVSKKPFDARVAWVDENAAQIIAAARHPDAFFDWWTQADSPFCFLQACFEYAEWADSGYSPEFLSTISGAADGSCSGLQHYAAITRSSSEAYHVNLVPRADVGDIYQVTADVAVPSLQAAADRGEEAAGIILANGFGRSEVKRNVMTYFYGSARFGMRDQHMQDLMRPLADEVAMGLRESHPYNMLTERTDKETGEVTEAWDGGYTCAALMAAHVYQAVTTVASKADDAAKWIQSVASTLAHEGKSLSWRTQTGFPVVQRYAEYTHKEVNLWLYDRSLKVPTGTDRTDGEGNVLSRIRVLLREAPTSRVDKKAMRNASSPNLIHSMDAAHLHRSVAMAKREGIDHFCMIHDSFGTHLGNMGKFNRIIREALIACYEDYCPLEAIEAYAREVLSPEGQEKLPPRPARGDLDLQDLRNALYAFA